jgi:hypothetical protein
MKSEYDKQASRFLKENALAMRITLSDTKTASWAKDGEPSGHHYRVTISRADKSGRITFDFWGSQHDAATGADPSPYDVLACISSDVHCPDTFADFCDEYGYEDDSIKALQTFNRCHRFAARLNAFFTSAEVSQLEEIR